MDGLQYMDKVILQVIRAEEIGCLCVTRHFRAAEVTSNCVELLTATKDGGAFKGIITEVNDNTVAVLSNLILESLPNANVCVVNVSKYPILELSAQIAPLDWYFASPEILSYAKELMVKRKEDEFLVVVIYGEAKDVRLVTKKPLERVAATDEAAQPVKEDAEPVPDLTDLDMADNIDPLAN